SKRDWSSDVCSSDLAKPAAPAVEYGSPADATLAWDEAARERMKQIPAFVRGMVAKRVEAYCRDRQIGRVSEEVLTEIRAKMPTRSEEGRVGEGGRAR